MPYEPDRHHRRSIRLQGYDYAQVEAYFVTVCTQNRECLFGEVVDGDVRLNDAGRMVERWWHELPRKFPGVETDALVVMPNHIHGIVVIVGADVRVGPGDPDVRPDDLTDSLNPGVPKDTPRLDDVYPPPSLPTIVQWFKTMTTNEYIRGVKEAQWSPFPGRLWQRNYYEHIIRTEAELDRIRQYVVDNPAHWVEDAENPSRHI